MKYFPKDPDEWDTEKTFKSKKNTVLEIEYKGEHYIVKKFDPEFIEGLTTEREILEECDKKGIRVPEIIESTEDTLILEYISGDNCKELFDVTESEEKKREILSEIARWLAGFHSSFGFRKRRGDSILANFILTEEGVYGIDFEESKDYAYLRDVGDMCTSILRLRPAFTQERFSQVDSFIDEYFSNISKEKMDMTDKVVESLKHYLKYSSMGDEMIEWAERIRRSGLSSRFQD